MIGIIPHSWEYEYLNKEDIKTKTRKNRIRNSVLELWKWKYLLDIQMQKSFGSWVFKSGIQGHGL